MAAVRKQVRRKFLALASCGLFYLLGKIPRELSLALVRFLGSIAYWVDRRRRRYAIANCRMALARVPFAAINETLAEEIVFQSYLHLAAHMVDLSRSNDYTVGQLSCLVRSHGASERLREILHQGRGVILLSPHLGNWELLPIYLSARGLHVNFVARVPRNPGLLQLTERVRTTRGAIWIRRGGAFAKIREALEGNEVVIMLMDQDSDQVRGTYVEFFGRLAWTPTGPAVLARMTGAAMVPGALVRRPDDYYSFRLEPTILLSCTGQEPYDDWENTRRATVALQHLIATYPEQWVWFHRRWKTWVSPEWQPPYSAKAAPGPADEELAAGEAA